jgi:glycosyltransferase involved in cell wall biosynthesis
MRRLRILHLADHMGYGGRIPHGMTTYLLLVLPRIRAAGHEVTAAFLREPHECGADLERQGVGTRFLNTRRWDPLIPLKAANLVRALDPDIVHATQVQAVLVARLLKAAGMRFRLVVHMHNLDVLPGALRWASRGLPQPETALCVSGAVTTTATRQYGIDPSRLRIFPNALDTERFLSSIDAAGPDLRAELDLPRSARLIGRVARFHSAKGNDRLVRAMPYILAAVPDACAIFAGDGPERAKCQALAQQLGVGTRLRFLGQRSDVARIVAACEIMTVTSPAEPFGFVALEAFALGKPVVGFNSGGLPEVVTHGVDGLLAAADDEREFGALVARVLVDSDLRARLSAGAQASIGRFSIAQHVEALLAIYEQRTAQPEVAQPVN